MNDRKAQREMGSDGQYRHENTGDTRDERGSAGTTSGNRGIKSQDESETLVKRKGITGSPRPWSSDWSRYGASRDRLEITERLHMLIGRLSTNRLNFLLSVAEDEMRLYKRQMGGGDAKRSR